MGQSIGGGAPAMCGCCSGMSESTAPLPSPRQEEVHSPRNDADRRGVAASGSEADPDGGSSADAPSEAAESRNVETDKRPRVSRRSTSSRQSDGNSYAKGDCVKRNSGAVGKPFPPRPMMCKLSATAWKKLEDLFRCMDTDGSNAVTKVEAQAFFKGAFSSLSADAMFNEVDVDQSGAITGEEFAQFWLQVRASGYEEQDIIDEVEVLMEGNTWVDWMDGRDTGKKEVCTYPRKPFLCRLGGKAWGKSEELFRKLCGDGSLILTRTKATSFFKGTFTKISVEAMFNEVDVNNHGVITPEEWIAFWLQVKSHGYKDSDIVQELSSMLEGSPWVDWKDGRNT